MAKIVTVRLMLDVETENEAMDAVNEILREEQCSSFSPDSPLLDYQMDGIVADVPYDESYQQGDAFV